jgi:hypothetical protein
VLVYLEEGFIRYRLSILCLLLAGIACIAQSEHVSAFWHGNSGGGAVTFDPSNKGTDVTLSSGNLSATNTSASNVYETARSTTSHSAGKYYVEFIINVQAANNAVVLGFANGSSGLNDYISDGNNGVGFYNTIIALNNTQLKDITVAHSQGDNVSMAIDFGGQLIWYRINGRNWNNDPTGNPATGAIGATFSTMAAGPYFAAVSMNGSGNNNQVTANFGGTAYTYTPPSGFGNW